MWQHSVIQPGAGGNTHQNNWNSQDVTSQRAVLLPVQLIKTGCDTLDTPLQGSPKFSFPFLFILCHFFPLCFEHFTHPQRWQVEIQKPFDNCQVYLEIKSWNPLVHQNPTEADPLWKWFLMIPWLLSPKWLCCRTRKKIMIGKGGNRFLFPT